ncbi:MAG: phytoene desaturase [Deltaproteobacteria bacterium]|nr:phytoene desaturase [Deltaproteobacteria bacterium]
MTERVLIVGAGVGGLATAIRLQAAGKQVHVVERAQEVGGRCSRIRDGGFQFDVGPTLLLMKPVFEELFASAGRKLSDYLELSPCDPNYEIWFGDGESVVFSTQLREMQKELERLQPGAFGGYLRYLEEGRKGMAASLDRFVGRNFDSLAQFATPANLKTVLDVNAHRSLYSVVSRHFHDERLRIALSFQTMYLGISPYEAPGVYSLLPYTELADGIWFPKGGLYAVPQALERLARELGVTFELGKAVAKVEIENNVARGVHLADGSRRSADTVVLNADLPYAYRELLPDSPLPRADKLKFTSSALMFYWGLDRQAPRLRHHNIFLADFADNFADIFERGRVPEDPSFYVNVATRSDASLGPAGRDGVYVLVPVPHLGPRIDWDAEVKRVRERVLTRLAGAGCDLRGHIALEHVRTPKDWRDGLNLEHGAAFGLSHDLFQVGYFRPANQHARYKNVYFVGASTQPGTGLPMVVLSSRLTTERIMKALAARASAPATRMVGDAA